MQNGVFCLASLSATLGSQIREGLGVFDDTNFATFCGEGGKNRATLGDDPDPRRLCSRLDKESLTVFKASLLASLRETERYFGQNPRPSTCPRLKSHEKHP